MENNNQYKARQYAILFLGFLTLIYAMAMPDRRALVVIFEKLLTSPTHLLTDFLALVGPSATFLNVSGHFFIAYVLMSRNERSRINGLQIGAVGLFTGHAFFGTTIFNVIPIILGVFLYAKFTKQSFKLYTTISLFATSMAPIVSYLAFYQSVSGLSLVLANVTGLVLGFIAPALAEEFLKFHRGLTLYNYGFTTGIITMFVVLLLPYTGVEILPQNLVTTAYHPYLLLYLSLLLLILVGVVVKQLKTAIDCYPKLLTSTGRVPDDFVSKYGLSATVLNMCLMLLIYTVLLLSLKIKLSGPVVGGLLTITGFSAFGKHPRNSLPISLGVLLAALGLNHGTNDLKVALPLLFATGLSPIAGFYGLTYGIVAGFLHYSLSSTTFYLHQGLSLYNNGFSTGFVAAFLAPLIDTLQDHSQYWMKGKNNVNRKK